MRIAEFGGVQIIVQLLAALTGLLIVRQMSKSEYVLFALVSSMQSACLLLSDAGMGIGVATIAGRVWNDPQRFGQLLNTAMGLRRKFAAFSMLVCLPISAWLFWRNGAGPLMTATLCAMIAAGLVPSLVSSVLGTALLLHGDYRRMQTLSLGGAALRLLLITLLTITKLSAVTAMLASVVINYTQAHFVRPWAAARADLTAPPSEGDRCELFSVAIKSLPNAVLYCFQGQVTILILTVVGKSTEIADAAALGRIGMIFAVSGAVFSGLLVPRFAVCQDPAQVRWLYFILAGGSGVLLSLLTAVAWLYATPFLWLLGPKYSGLEHACGLIVAGSCASQLAGAMFNLNANKGWVRYSIPGNIPVVVGTQLIAALFLDLRQFNDVLIFAFFTAFAPIPLYLVDAVFGLKQRSSEGVVLTAAAEKSTEV